MKKLCVLGKDNRSLALKGMYINEGSKFVTYNKADVILAPIPFSRDDIKINGENIECNELISKIKGKRLYSGAISQSMKEKLKENNIEFYDLMEYENVAILNAIPTAEGAIAAAMEMTDFTLHDSNVLVMGYGKIGKILSKMLQGIGARVFCEARSKKDLALIKANGYYEVDLSELDKYLPKMDVIFNTIPITLLNEERLKLLNCKCSIVDLASSPGGVDFIKAKELKINVIWALSLPSKVAPFTAAKYLKDTIDDIEESKK